MSLSTRYLGGNAPKASGTDVSITTQNSVPSGSIVYILAGGDNLSGTTPTYTVTTPDGAATSISNPNAASTTGAASEKSQLFRIVTTSTWGSGATITITASSPVTARNSMAIAVVSTAQIDTTSGNVNNGQSNVSSWTLNVGTGNAGDVVLGFVMTENSSAPATPSGWTLEGTVGTSGGNAQTNINSAIHSVIAVDGATFSYAPTTSSDMTIYTERISEQASTPVSTTDTLSVSITETSSVVITNQTIATSDTLSTSITESSAFGPVIISASDTLNVSVTDSADAGPEYRRGINDSGAEFGGTLPGVYDTDYHYDGNGSMTYLAGRGMDLIRVPFKWERIQPTLGGALDANELSRLNTMVTNIANNGMKAILDVHNFGQYQGISFGNSGGPTQANFVDLWTKLSTQFKNNAGVWAYGLMNEPHDLPGTSGAFSGTVRYDWNDATVQGWTGDAATASNVGSQLRLSGTISTAGSFWNMRKDDAGTLRGSGSGNYLRALVTLQNTSPTGGEFHAVLQWQNASYSWRSGTTTYKRVDTGATVTGLIPGVQVEVVADFTSDPLTGNRAFAIQIDNNSPGTGTVTVDIDDFSQGSLAGSRNGNQVWEDISNAAVTAIRNNSDTKRILVAGSAWSGAQAWSTTHPAPWITTPGGIYYEAHYYPDANNDGVFDSYDTENTAAVNAGYTGLADKATQQLNVFLNWLSTNKVKGFIGEMGWSKADIRWNAVGDTMYNVLDSAKVGATYWATGEWYGSGYDLSPYETGGGSSLSITTQNARIIENHLTPGLTAPTQQISSTDTLNVSITENHSFFQGASIFASDTLSVSVSETSNAVYPGKWPTYDSHELFDISAQYNGAIVRKTAGDTLSVSITEARSFAPQAITASDTLNVSVTDATQKLMNVISVTDTLSTSITEGRQFATVNVTATDTLSTSITEARSFGTVNVTATDTLSTSITETSVPFKMLPGSDSLAVSITETSSINVSGIIVKNGTDTLSVSITEQVQPGTTAFGTSDTLTVSISETSKVTRLVTASDTLSVSITENTSGYIPKSANDSLGISISETTSIVKKPMLETYAWDGTTWQPGEVYVWDGTQWLAAEMYYWTGSVWA